MVEDNKKAEIEELEHKVEELQGMIIALRNDLKQRSDLRLEKSDRIQIQQNYNLERNNSSGDTQVTNNIDLINSIKSM